MSAQRPDRKQLLAFAHEEHVLAVDTSQDRAVIGQIPQRKSACEVGR